MSELISIIVPIYNSQNYIEETIQSVLNQTYQNWELLLVDDGSNDDSARICKYFVNKHSRIQYLYKTNGGQASARNLGIKKSNGTWIALIDSDDIWHPEKLQKQVEIILEHKQINLCFTNTSSFTNTIDNECENYNKHPYGIFNNNQLFNLIYVQNHIANSSVIFKKTLLNKIGKIDENPKVVGSEDWDYLLRILKTDSCSYGIAEQLLFYRLHEGGVHNQSIKMFKGKIYVYSKYDNDTSIPRLLRLRQYRYVYRELVNYLFDKRKFEEIKAVHQEFSEKDKFGLSTITQRLLIKILPIPKFIWVSNKIVYRVSYRLESLSYLFFLR